MKTTPVSLKLRPTRTFVLTLTTAGCDVCPHPSSFAAGEAYKAMCVFERGPMAARKMAAAVAGDEGSAVWLDPAMSTCVEARETDAPRVVIVGSPVTIE